MRHILGSVLLGLGLACSVPAGSSLHAQSAPAATVGGLSAARIEVARVLEGNRPGGVTTTLSVREAGRFFIFASIANSTGAEAHVTIGWRRQGEDHDRGRMPLTIPAQRRPWTTFARAHVTEAGAWEAVVRTEAGEVVGVLPFTVQ